VGKSEEAWPGLKAAAYFAAGRDLLIFLHALANRLQLHQASFTKGMTLMLCRIGICCRYSAVRIVINVCARIGVQHHLANL